MKEKAANPAEGRVEEALEPTLRKVKMILEYDGTRFHGWQRQPRTRTIQGELEEKLSVIVRHPVRVVAAGRTDAGVHALGQVAAFETEGRVPLDAIQKGINALLRPTVVVREIEEVPLDFHPRFDAQGKRYRYRILNRSTPSAFEHHRAWHLRTPLDVEAMAAATAHLVGEHDFSAFRASDCDAKHPIRRITAARWQRVADLLSFEIEGRAFLKHMVRIIVGTLVDVGLGRCTPDRFREILEGRDRTRAG
ncbi:MAG: tRNA pseudouridine(38-40) synthase TruA, partial [Deltaproteobacteria bacterium]